MGVGIPLGPYRLVKRLAVGGMAEIFLARKEGPEGFARDLVVKRILPHLAEDRLFSEMFLEEARIAARLSHPHVVAVYDCGEVDGNLCTIPVRHHFLLRDIVKHKLREGSYRVPACFFFADSLVDGLAVALA